MTEDDGARRRRARSRRSGGAGTSGLRALRGRFAVRSRREERGLPYVDADGADATGNEAAETPVTPDRPARSVSPISSYAGDGDSEPRKAGKKRRSTPVGRREELDVGPGWYVSQLVGWLAVAVVSFAGGALIPVIFATGPLTLLETKLTDGVYVYERPVIGAIGLSLVAPLLGGIICVPLVSAPAAALGRVALAALALARSWGTTDAVTFTRRPGPRGLVPVRRTRISDAVLTFSMGSWSGGVAAGAWAISTAVLYAIGIVRWPVTSPVLIVVLGLVPLGLAGWGTARAVRGWRRGADGVTLGRLYARSGR
ncbi:hypothetical protein Bcav_2712 [Beutenbergia cavernae DSM 12333]|uniref:Uncharacterized protein n=1 Tax=Beutenbergia cavernae (strain ATCC BAA-8 / DSM 12333 / CCUG 43141 / JCM 11478 / NBRC 16432 / NCIMB 13614 / HKI 0122) TaxID=471853 RepID=C5BY57_BEUC1|nr:hypothetical protein [Beutenbergia cavernae]ACQ80957.1 hypothetical protein Bcav_2712 [Beutenbergia cavernae DSM 12333]